MRLGLFLAIFSFTLITPMVVPDVAVAQISLAEYAGCSGPDCSACNLVNLANGLITWLIGFLFIIFAIIIAYAGFGLVTSGGNHHELDEAKNRFVNALIGLIIVLAAWLIVDTIMRGLVGREGAEGQIPNGQVSGWLYWSTVECYSQPTPQEREFTPETFEPHEEIPTAMLNTYLIDQGSGNAGQVTINTPAGTQVVDIRACDTSQLGTTNFLGMSVTVNRQFIPSLQRIDARWRQMGGNSFYRVYSVGGYNCRNIAGTNRRSNHAYGLAIDINPADNPHTRPGDPNYGRTNMPPAFRQLFLNEGWGWGGNWNSSKDTMHYSKAPGEGGNMRGG